MPDDKTSLGDILSGTDPERSAPEPATAPPTTELKPEPASQTVEAREERARREDGTFAPKTDTPEQKQEAKPEAKTEPKPEAKEPPKEEFTPRERAFLKATEEERRKRQELERQLTAMQKPAEPPKQFYEDPEGALARSQESTRTEMMTHKLQIADMVGAVRYPDYVQKRDIFMKICETNPQYAQAAINSPDPAAFAYSVAKQAIERHEWEQAGGAEGMRKKLETELRAKWDAEHAQTKQKEAEKLDAIPGSLSEVQGRGIRSAPVWTGPSPLADIIKH